MPWKALPCTVNSAQSIDMLRVVPFIGREQAIAQVSKYLLCRSCMIYNILRGMWHMIMFNSNLGNRWYSEAYGSDCKVFGNSRELSVPWLTRRGEVPHRMLRRLSRGI